MHHKSSRPVMVVDAFWWREIDTGVDKKLFNRLRRYHGRGFRDAGNSTSTALNTTLSRAAIRSDLHTWKSYTTAILLAAAPTLPSSLEISDRNSNDALKPLRENPRINVDCSGKKRGRRWFISSQAERNCVILYRIFYALIGDLRDCIQNIDHPNIIERPR